MTLTISGIDVRVLAYELEQEIIGSWIVNIYQIPNGIFILKLRKPQVGLQFLLLEPGKRIHLTQFNRMMPKSPTNFCKTLRSHLRDRRINSIEQKELDRLVTINIGPEPGSILVIELFGEGNLILVSPENKIICALRYRRMRDRDIHPGKTFIQLPSQKRDILRHGTNDLPLFLKNNPKLVPALNDWLGLGPYYSRYLLLITGIKKKKSSEVDENEIILLSNEAEKLKLRLIEHNYSPTIYLDSKQETNDLHKIDELDEIIIETKYDDQWSDDSLPFLPENVLKILPWHQMLNDDEEIEIYEPSNLGYAFDIFYSSQEKQEDLTEESEQLETETDRLSRLLQHQISHQNNLHNLAKQYRASADALYANFLAGNELITTVYDARKNKMDWEEIDKRLQIGKEKGISSAKLYEELLINEGKMKLILPYENDILPVIVDFRENLTDNANKMYQLAKKSEKKAKGAEIAINNSKEKIQKAKSQAVDVEIKVREQSLVLKRRKQWYEKWHWTITENKTLILIGYDASANEKLVKRYLDPDDMFVHADIQGAAATVVKCEGKKPSENTLNIAASMAVSYSSAWKAQRPMADAFIVESDQVSLAPPTGEYLPKGSFMIYGEKRYIKNIMLEMYVGVIIEKSWARIIAGTKDSIKDATCWVKLLPGEISTGKIAKNLKNKFMKMVEPKDIIKIKCLDNAEIAWYIPGNSKIIEYSK